VKIRNLIEDWPKSYIKDEDLASFFKKSDDARYSFVKRALKAGELIRIRRGLYLIKSKIKLSLPDEFELALIIYGPSFVSFESALSYHGWIPESVYTITCASAKRAKEFKTPVGVFSYKRVPEENFYMGVERIETQESVIFIAQPWRALADFIYTRKKNWKNLEQLENDLRIDKKTLIESDKEFLKLLTEKYPSHKVRQILKKFLKEIVKISQEKL